MPTATGLLTQKECFAAAERLAFDNGGWLELSSRLGVHRDALRRRFAVGGSAVEARAWLGFIERRLAGEKVSPPDLP